MSTKFIEFLFDIIRCLLLRHNFQYFNNCRNYISLSEWFSCYYPSHLHSRKKQKTNFHLKVLIMPTDCSFLFHPYDHLITTIQFQLIIAIWVICICGGHQIFLSNTRLIDNLFTAARNAQRDAQHRTRNTQNYRFSVITKPGQ